MSDPQTDDASASTHKLKPGFVIDKRYEIINILGRGGFATVYRARHLQLDQEVALKVLMVSDDFKERFYREAKTAASIKHPDVVTIFDYGMLPDEHPYMVMEMLHGRPLDNELNKNGGMEVTRAQRLFVRCLDALQAAHNLNVVHRDLKPANLFLTDTGSRVEALRILDFGIALMLTEDTRLTSTGQLFGTPRYLAPEYIQKNMVTPALDVYQMGLIFVETLTGRNIIEAENNFTFIFAHCNGEISVPKQLMDSPLGPVIARALSTDVKTRFQSAGEFRDALEAVDLSELKGRFFRLPKVREGVEPETMIIIREYEAPDPSKPIPKPKHLPAASTAPTSVGGGAVADQPSGSRPKTVELGAEDVEFVTASTLAAADAFGAPVADADADADGGGAGPAGRTAVLEEDDLVDAVRPRPARAASRESLHSAATKALTEADLQPPGGSPDKGEAPSRGVPMVALVGGGVALLVVIGVIAAIAFSGGSGEATDGGGLQGKVPPVTAPPATAPPATVATPVSVASVEAPATAAPEPPASVEVEVQITAEPGNARLLRGDQVLADGAPARLKFASAEAEAQEICADLRGYVRKCQNVRPGDAPTVTLKLDKARGNTGPGRDDGKKPPTLELPE